MRAIVDSGVLIGAKYSKDQYSKISIEILEHLKNGFIKKIYITNYVVLECVNFLLRKTGFERANETLNYLMNTDNIEIVEIDLESIGTIFQRYKTLSITDCSLIVLSERLKIKEIFSFDGNFDSVKGITRLTAL